MLRVFLSVWDDAELRLPLLGDYLEDGLAVFLTWFATRHPYWSAGIVLVAVGTVRLVSMLATTRAAAPRRAGMVWVCVVAIGPFSLARG